MTMRRLHRRLRRARAIPAPRAHHREALRADLVARFRMRPPSPVRRRATRWRPVVLVAVVAVLLAMLQAPVSCTLTVGQRIVIQPAPAEFNLPLARDLRAQLSALDPGVDARLFAYHDPAGGTAVVIDLFGERRADEVVARLLAAHPRLEPAAVKVVPLSGRACATLVDLLGHVLRVRPLPRGALDSGRPEISSGGRAHE